MATIVERRAGEHEVVRRAGRPPDRRPGSGTCVPRTARARRGRRDRAAPSPDAAGAEHDVALGQRLDRTWAVRASTRACRAAGTGRSRPRRRRCGARRRAGGRARSGPGWCPGTRRRARGGSGAGTCSSTSGSVRNSWTVTWSRSSKSMAPALRRRAWYSPVDVGDLALEHDLGPVGVGLGGDVVVLGRRDRGVDLPGGEPLRVEVLVADDVAGEALGVGLVVDGERRRVAEPGAVPTQDAHARRVERRHPHLLRRPARPAHRPGAASRRRPCW